MGFGLQLLAITLSIILLVLVIELIRQRRLREKYALLWFATAIVILILSLKLDLLSFIAKALGIQIASNALFLFGIVFLVLIVLGLTITASGLARKNERLAQEFAIFARRIEELENQKDTEYKNEKRKDAKK